EAAAPLAALGDPLATLDLMDAASTVKDREAASDDSSDLALEAVPAPAQTLAPNGAGFEMPELAPAAGPAEEVRPLPMTGDRDGSADFETPWHWDSSFTAVEPDAAPSPTAPGRFAAGVEPAHSLDLALPEAGWPEEPVVGAFSRGAPAGRG